MSVSLVFQEHCHQFSVYSLVSRVHRDSCVSHSGVSKTSSSVFCVKSGVQSAQGQQCQSVWCFKNIVISFLYIVRCPEGTATAVSVSLVFQEHRQQFSVYSLVSRVHRDSSVSQSGVSRTSSAVICVKSGVQSAQGQQCQSGWCFKNTVSSYLCKVRRLVRCPECTGIAVSISLVF